MPITGSFRLAMMLLLLFNGPALAQEDWQSVQVENGQLPYLASRPPGAAVTQAVLVLHGHPRDALQSFRTLQAQAPQALVVAPLFQVAAGKNKKCDSTGNPPAAAGDLLWTCSSWIAGGPAINAPQVTAFAALQQLLVQIVRQWPGVSRITLVGFSAGAQFLQHSVAFTRPPANVRLNYLIASPGSWLYFTPQRPALGLQSACQAVNQWKYGLQGPPAGLPSPVAGAAQRYAQASIRYLAGERDDGPGPGAAYAILDKSCAAMAQGRSRLERAQQYLQLENRARPATAQRLLGIAAGCGHQLACVINSPAGRAALAASLAQP